MLNPLSATKETPSFEAIRWSLCVFNVYVTITNKKHDLPPFYACS